MQHNERDPNRDHFAVQEPRGKKLDPSANVNSLIPKVVAAAASKLNGPTQVILALTAFAATMGLGGILQTYATPATATGKQADDLTDKLKESDAKVAQLQKALEKTELKQWMERTESDLAAIKSAIDPVRLGERRQNAEIAKLRSAIVKLNGGSPHPTWLEKGADWEALPLSGRFAMVNGVPDLARKPLYITSTPWALVPED